MAKRIKRVLTIRLVKIEFVMEKPKTSAIGSAEIEICRPAAMLFLTVLLTFTGVFFQDEQKTPNDRDIIRDRK